MKEKKKLSRRFRAGKTDNTWRSKFASKSPEERRNHPALRARRQGSIHLRYR